MKNNHYHNRIPMTTKHKSVKVNSPFFLMKFMTFLSTFKTDMHPFGMVAGSPDLSLCGDRDVATLYYSLWTSSHFDFETISSTISQKMAGANNVSLFQMWFSWVVPHLMSSLGMPLWTHGMLLTIVASNRGWPE